MLKACVRTPNRNTEQNQLQLDAQREQGKRDNQAFNDELMRGLKADKTVDAQSKAIGEAALTKLRLDLGRNPLQTASAIVADAQTRAKIPGLSKHTFSHILNVFKANNRSMTHQLPQKWSRC